MVNKVETTVVSQSFINRCSLKDLDALTSKVVQKKIFCFFDSDNTYKLFLKTITKKINPDLVMRATEIFFDSFGKDYEIVEFKSKDNKSLLLPAKLLKHKFPFFQTTLQKINQTELSFKALELFACYLKDQEWKFTQASVMNELLEWSKTLSENSLDVALKQKVSFYFLEKNHESDFKELHVPYMSISFIFTYFKKFLKELEFFDNRIAIIEYKEFIQLFTSKINPVFLTFLIKKLDNICLRIDQKTEPKELLKVPYAYRKYVRCFIFDSSCNQAETLYRTVNQFFPNLDLIPEVIEDLPRKLKNANSPMKLILCSSYARHTNQARQFLFEVHKKFAEDAEKILLNAPIREMFFKEFQKLQENLLLDVCFEEIHNESPEFIEKALDLLRKLRTVDPIFLSLFANTLLLAKIIGLKTPEDASDFYYQALAKFPNQAILHRNLAFSLFLKGTSLKKSGESLAAQEFFRLSTGYAFNEDLILEDDYINTHLRADLSFLEADHLWKNKNFRDAFEKYRMAEKHYLKLYDKNRTDFSVLENLAHTQFRLSQYLSKTGRTSEALKKFEQTEESYKELNELRSNNFSTFKDLGKIYTEHAQLLQKAALEIEDQENSEEVRVLEYATPSQKDFLKSKTQGDEEQANKQTKLLQKAALEQGAQDNYEEAQIYFGRAHLIKSQNFSVLTSLAFTLYHQGLHLVQNNALSEADKKLKTALKYLAKAIPQDEDNMPFESLTLVHFQLARTSTKVVDSKSHLEKAIHFGLKALKQDRYNFDIFQCLAISYKLQAEQHIRKEENDEVTEKLKEAKNYASKGLELKKEDRALTHTLAVVSYFLATQGSDDEFQLSQRAEICLLKALRHTPKDAHLQEYLAHIIFQQADYHLQKNEERVAFQRLLDAEQEYLKACNLNPTNFAIARDLEDIILLLIQFLDDNPQCGDIYEKYSDLEKASSRSLKIKPLELISINYLSMALHHLAKMDMENKDFDRAEKRLNLLIKLPERFHLNKDSIKSEEVNPVVNFTELEIVSRINNARFRYAKCVFENNNYTQALKRFSLIEGDLVRFLAKFPKHFADYFSINSKDLIGATLYQIECLIKLNLPEDVSSKLADIESYMSKYEYKTDDDPEVLRKLSRCYFFQAQQLKSKGKHAEAAQKLLTAKKYSEDYIKANCDG